MTELEGENSEDEETLAESLIKRVFRTATRGKQDIVEIRIHEERKSGIGSVENLFSWIGSCPVSAVRICGIFRLPHHLTPSWV